MFTRVKMKYFLSSQYILQQEISIKVEIFDMSYHIIRYIDNHVSDEPSASIFRSKFCHLNAVIFYQIICRHNVIFVVLII
jgi:hypothetical protein